MTSPLEALQNRSKLLSSSLSNSSTAYAPNTSPTTSDLRTSSELDSINKKIDTLKSTQLRNKWYGSNTNDVPAEGDSTPDGLFVSGLKALSRPLNAVVGAGQYIIGKGTESSFAGNINQAMKTGLTSGTVLKQLGAPRAIQVPLGFALDVMLDPVNWATAGTSALLPRAGYGLIKGIKEGGMEAGLSALKEGVVSNVAKKATTALNMVPFAKNSTRYTNLAKNLGETAVSGAEKFNTLVKKDVYDKLGKGLFGMPSGIIGKTVENTVKKIPSVSLFGKSTPSGEKIVDFFKYSTQKAADVANLKDKVFQLARNKGAILTRTEKDANFQSIDEFLRSDAKVKLPSKIKEGANEAIQHANEAVEIRDPSTGLLKPEYAGTIKVHDTLENAQSLLESAKEDYNLKHLVDAYKVTPAGKTGVQWYDDVVDKIRATTVGDVLHGRLHTEDPNALVEGVQQNADELVNTWNSYGNKVKDWKPFDKIFSAQQGLLSVFKSAKVPMNVASHVVSTIGNFTMGLMMGLPVWKPEYMNSMIRSNLLVKGRLGAAGFKEMFFSDVNSLIDLADNNPTRFKQLTGMDPREIAGKLSTEEKLTDVINRKNMGPEQLRKTLEDAWNRLEEGLSQRDKLGNFKDVAEKTAKLEAESSVNKKIIKEGFGRFETPSEITSRMLKEAPIRRTEEAGSWLTSEVSQNAWFDRFKAHMAKEAEVNSYNPVYRVANTLVNSMPRWYEHIDQTFKIGTADYLTKVGLSEQELSIVSRTIPIAKTDILEPIVKGGEKLYRLTPLKAADVATEAFMNYSAMPDFVRILRALPIVGVPFFSFPYAMAIKTAKTAINNPAIFNKIGFIINEMNVGRTPQEKMAMEEKYNQYLKSPTVMKIFGMWNTDVKNFIPYYQMNMFNPSERTYDNSAAGQTLKYLDKVPAFQDPVGSVIKDYFIQPWILSGSGQVPQGQFGQPLYPSYDENGKKINVGVLNKLPYAARTVAESVVPGVFGYAGLANIPGELSPEAVEFLPSYGARNLANATQGRSSVGATTKEDAVRKTLRSLLGRTGLPAYTLDVTKSTTSNKK